MSECKYPQGSSGRKGAAAAKTNSAEAGQEKYQDFKGGAKSVSESNYAGNKVKSNGSYKPESAKTTKPANYS